MSKVEELIKLKQLLDEGAISQEEFEEKRLSFLPQATAKTAPAVSETQTDDESEPNDNDAPTDDDGATDFNDAPRAATTRQQPFTKLESILSFVGWGLLAVGILGFLAIIIVGLVEYERIYFYDGFGSTTALTAAATALMLAGGALALTGWLMGVARGFGGKRTVFFIITVAAVVIALAFSSLSWANAAGVALDLDSGSSGSSASGSTADEIAAQNAVKTKLKAMVAESNGASGNTWTYSSTVFNSTTYYNGSYQLTGRVYVLVNGLNYSAIFYATTKGGVVTACQFVGDFSQVG